MKVNISNCEYEELIRLKKEIKALLMRDTKNIQSPLIDEKKCEILKKEVTLFDSTNVASLVQKVIKSIPDNLTALEKVRYVYIKLGRIFSYDYRVVDDISFATKMYDVNGFIDRYETCVQISGVMNWALNQIEGVKSKSVGRNASTIRGLYGEEHYANAVTIKLDEDFSETYLLDLTLDLYLIQSGCKTQHFGFETNISCDYDIMPRVITDQIDKKLGFVFDDGYMDEKITFLKEELEKESYSNMSDSERIDYKLSKIIDIVPQFNGYHEAIQFVRRVFKHTLNEEYEEFSLYHKSEGNTNMKTCYKIITDSYIKYVVYSKELGFISMDENLLISMLGFDWKTRSISRQ